MYNTRWKRNRHHWITSSESRNIARSVVFNFLEDNDRSCRSIFVFAIYASLVKRVILESHRLCKQTTCVSPDSMSGRRVTCYIHIQQSKLVWPVLYIWWAGLDGLGGSGAGRCSGGRVASGSFSSILLGKFLLGLWVTIRDQTVE